MEYQKIINLLNNKFSQTSKFRTKKWVEINEGARGTYNTNIQIKFETKLLKSKFMWLQWRTYNSRWKKTDAGANTNNKQAIFKYCALLTDCISRINNI